MQCSSKTSNPDKQPDFKWEPPKEKAQLFLKDIIATGMNERDAALSPDGKTFFFTVQYSRHISAIAHTELKNGQWSKPEIVSFSGRYNDLEPVFHPDGEKLYFVSNRPVDENGKKKDYDIWYVEQTKNGWSKPVNPGKPLNTKANEFYPSFTNDGTIYFCAKRENSIGGEDIFYSKFKDGKYQPPQNPGDSINTKSAEYNAFVSPDGSFLMYNTHGRGKGHGSGDIYIAFKDNGKWKKPVNMGQKINSEFFEYCPALSPDGKYLFFTAQRMKINKKTHHYKDLLELHNSPQNGNGDIYWIDASVIKELKSK